MNKSNPNPLHLLPRIEAIKALLQTIEEDPNRDGLKDTPRRVAEMYDELFQGYCEKPEELLERVFDEDHHEMVIEKDIDFFSLCEHHMVPFFGKVHIGYIPKGKIVGFSKLSRLVDCFAHRLQVQERLTTQIADTIQECLEPLGVIVVIEAKHLCMIMRGVKKANVENITSAVRGVFAEKDNNARPEFLSLIRRSI